MVNNLLPAKADTHPFHLSLIHDFELRCGGELVQMSPNSQRVVGFVALHDRPVRRAKVSGTLWLDSPEDRASASLRSALWRIPAPRGQNVLAASTTHVWLNAHVRVDLHDAIARARSLLSSTPMDLTALNVARELASFGGDLLPGWYEDWLVMERERFHYLRLQVLDKFGDQLCAHGRFGDALQMGLAAVAAEPLRESAHRLVIRAHLGQGNIAEAIRQYHSYERMLADELSAVPSEAMLALAGSCRELRT
jgi:DNA-binding SARP family transcriptional activator